MKELKTVMETKTIQAHAGDHLKTVCATACEVARVDACRVQFDFNGQTLTALPGTDPRALMRSYDEECARRHAEYVTSPEYQEGLAETKRKEREMKKRAEAILNDAPPMMSLIDADGWEKARAVQSAPYGAAVMIFAERWARLMEARMGKGERLDDIAKECLHIADEEGITGFMYGAAVATLAQVWKHGDALRRWHNAGN